MSHQQILSVSLDDFETGVQHSIRAGWRACIRSAPSLQKVWVLDDQRTIGFYGQAGELYAFLSAIALFTSEGIPRRLPIEWEPEIIKMGLVPIEFYEPMGC
jgi:hypothetical protein